MSRPARNLVRGSCLCQDDPEALRCARCSLALLVAFAAGAAAKTSPVERPAEAARIDDGAIYLGPAGVMLEQDYFNVPRPQAGATRIFPCSFHLRATRGTTLVGADLRLRKFFAVFRGARATPPWSS